MYKTIKTVGELREILQNLPNDMPLLSYQSDMEKSGYVNKVYIDALNMAIKEKKTYDAFDYTPYSYEVYAPSAQGEECIVFG